MSGPTPSRHLQWPTSFWGRTTHSVPLSLRARCLATVRCAKLQLCRRTCARMSARKSPRSFRICTPCLHGSVVPQGCSHPPTSSNATKRACQPAWSGTWTPARRKRKKRKPRRCDERARAAHRAGTRHFAGAATCGRWPVSIQLIAPANAAFCTLNTVTACCDVVNVDRCTALCCALL